MSTPTSTGTVARAFQATAAARANCPHCVPMTGCRILVTEKVFLDRGSPTLVQLTHGDVLARVAALRARLPSGDGWSAISWQPMADIAERLCTHYLPLVHGWQITTCADPGAVVALLGELRPEFFWAPPELWEELRVSVLARFDGSPERAAADRAAALGGIGLEHVRVAVVGAGLCRPELIGFWHALGLPLDEIYGLSGRPVAGGENATPTFKSMHRPTGVATVPSPRS